MSLPDDLLVMLSYCSCPHRAMRKRLYEFRKQMSSAQPHFSDTAMRASLSRFKKKGFVEKDKEIWSITRSGRKCLFGRAPFLRPATRDPISKPTKYLVIVFDIPEAVKKKRNWLRAALLKIGFKMLQKSVWIGPAPLPVDFLGALREFAILPYMKFFEVKEGDII